jgi:hypothetical protein
MVRSSGDQAVSLFSRNKKIGVQSFILNLVNNNCPELEALAEGPRLEGRVNLVVAVLVIPVEGGEPLAERAFTAVTKEFSSTGVALVLDEPKGLDEVILGFRWEREISFVRAVAKHLNPMGGGFFQLGLRMTEMVPAGDFPRLELMSV